MALPSSGQISMNNIRTELGIPSQSPFSLDTAENGGYVTLNKCSPSIPSSGNPAAISEWYGYNHSATCYNAGGFTYNASSCDNACAGTGTDTTLYSCCSTLAVDCKMWSNNTCTTAASDGYYSNGTNCYYISGGQIKTITACAANITLTICIKYGGTPAETLTNYGFYYALSSDGGSTYGADVLALDGGSITTTCDCTAFTLPANRHCALGFRTKAGGKGSGRYFTGTKLGGTCPAQAQDYCGTYAGGGSPYVTNWTTSNVTLYFTIYVDVKGDPALFVQC